ncbi:MAG TPA: DUF420 domain-containing protein [Epsilonproteobacteria bacterium]|nr:DUF420 domain-containing protein [Campylobacterota bacterium]
MEYMLKAGFLGTRAPLFMDMVTLIVALLPFLLCGAIWLAKIGNIKLHKIAQVVLFVVSVIVVGYFEFGVRFGGGFEEFIQGSSLNHTFVFYFLLLHIAIALVTLVLWSKVIFYALKSKDIQNHPKRGKQAAWWILATSLSGLGVYVLLFIS